MVNKNELLTSKEVAKLLRVGEWTIRQWRKKSVGPDFYTLEGNVRYPESAIDAFLKSRFRGTLHEDV